MVPTAPAEIRLDDDILFSDFMLKWLEVTKSTIQITTYASYQGMVERVIVPYFRKRNIKLVDLKATDLQDFYTKQLERVKANSVIHYPCKHPQGVEVCGKDRPDPHQSGR